MTTITAEVAHENAGGRWDHTVLLHVHEGTEEEIDRGIVSLTVSAAAVVSRAHEPDQIVLMMAAYGISRLEELLAEPGWQADAFQPARRLWLIDSTDVPDFVRHHGLALKDCRYQRASGSDMFCTGASTRDDFASLTIDGRLAAPTTLPLCGNCGIPDLRLICSSFTHANVVGIGFAEDATTIRRKLVGAMCAGGRDEIEEHPELCRPDGNPCWHRIPAEPTYPEPVSSPTALVDALDFLDTAWRLAFSERLIRGPSLADVAGLAQGCTTRDDFDHRMSDLAGVIEAFAIDDAHLSRDTPSDRRNGSINRLELAVTARRGDDLSPEFTDAIKALRRLIRVRVISHHPNAGTEGPGLFASLGLSWPPLWGPAWDQIRGVAVDAVSTIRAEVRRLA